MSLFHHLQAKQNLTMTEEDSLLQQMKDAKNEYERIKYRLDYTDTTNEQKRDYNSRKAELRGIWKDLNDKRNAILLVKNRPNNES